MPSLQVREVPAAIYGALAEVSRREHRSLSQQALVALERGLGFEEDPVKRRKRVIAEIAGSKPAIPKGLPDPVTILREDRAR